jgi:hypothetical protein
MSGPEGCIYLIITREFIMQQRPVFKVGHTGEIMKRFSAYPKGSRLLFSCYCCDTKAMEERILKGMRACCTHRTDLGREWFEGDINCIMHLIRRLTEQDPLDLFAQSDMMELESGEDEQMSELPGRWDNVGVEQVLKQAVIVTGDWKNDFIRMADVRALLQQQRCGTDLSVAKEFLTKCGCKFAERASQNGVRVIGSIFRGARWW